MADVELRILERDAQGYPVEVTLDMEQEFRRGHLAADAVPDLDAHGADFPAALRDFLLGDPNLSLAWDEIRGRAPRRRIRLRVDPPELSALPWEMLRERDLDGGPRPPVGASPETPLSRYLPGRGRLGTPVLERPVRMLVAIANPPDLAAKWGLSPIDAEGEIARLRKATAGSEVQLQVMDGPCTLSRLQAALRDGPHVLHFLGHGTFSARTQSASLFLADEDAPEQAKPVLAEEIEQAIQSVMGGGAAQSPLRLIVLMSCETAKTGTGDVLRGLAPRLIRAGVPAVIAMQDLVPMQTAERFSSAFYSRVLQHGQVDLAANEARAELLSAKLPGTRLPGYAIPALFMRLREGLLLGTRGSFGSAEQDRAQEKSFWPFLLRYLGSGKCIPIIGPRAMDGLLPAPEEMARRLAATFGYPLRDRDDLGRVAQYASIRDQAALRSEYLWTMAKWLGEAQLGRKLTEEEEGRWKPMTLNEVVRELDWGNEILHREGPTILHQLARLKLPLYVTTTADPLMLEALRQRGAEPRQEGPRWESGVGDPHWRLDAYDAQRPVVFHLNGHGGAFHLDGFDDPDVAARSHLVLANDDYLAQVVRLSRDVDSFLPSQLQSELAQAPILFVGFDLMDWSFRVVLDGLLRGIKRSGTARSIGVQLDVESDADREMVREYLRLDMGRHKIDIYWGTARQFVADLVDHYARARKERF